MRARMLFVAGVVMYGSAGCSPRAGDAPPDVKAAGEPVGSAPFELALTAPANDAAVVADIEVPRPVKKSAVRRTQRQPAAAAPASDANPEPAAAAEPAPEITLAAVGTPGASPIRSPAVAPRPSPAPAAAPEDGGHSHGGEAAEGERDGGDRGPGIIIRGGRGGRRDPCAIHGPRGPVDVLVNPRGPNPLAGDREPRVGRPSFPRGGGIRY